MLRFQPCTGDNAGAQTLCIISPGLKSCSVSHQALHSKALQGREHKVKLLVLGSALTPLTETGTGALACSAVINRWDTKGGRGKLFTCKSDDVSIVSNSPMQIGKDKVTEVSAMAPFLLRCQDPNQH